MCCCSSSSCNLYSVLILRLCSDSTALLQAYNLLQILKGAPSMKRSGFGSLVYEIICSLKLPNIYLSVFIKSTDKLASHHCCILWCVLWVNLWRGVLWHATNGIIAKHTQCDALAHVLWVNKMSQKCDILIWGSSTKPVMHIRK